MSKNGFTCRRRIFIVAVKLKGHERILRVAFLPEILECGTLLRIIAQSNHPTKTKFEGGGCTLFEVRTALTAKPGFDTPNGMSQGFEVSTSGQLDSMVAVHSLIH